jgi:hypothetical protein
LKGACGEEAGEWPCYERSFSGTVKMKGVMLQYLFSLMRRRNDDEKVSHMARKEGVII